MVSDWAFIGVFFLLAVFFPLLPILAGAWLGPRRPGRVKAEPYECGIRARGPIRIQFRASFYLYALAFLIFDVEAVFLFPWAAACNRLPLYAAVEGAAFLLLLGAGLAYLARKGGLAWQ
ncbi:MAG: NADH-quinone oxidoreductase subunit A [Anaerolineales bacterium]|nr:NADH-quinone oxidoreductase subunit A [Anaerolineales bacterium]